MALSQIKGSTGIADATITSAKLADFTAAVDLNGVELLLDADADTSISADTDDQIDIKIANADHLKILSSSGDTVLKPMVDAKDIIFQQFDGNKVFEINDGNFVSVGGNATAAGQIRIYEDTDNGSHYSGFTVGNLTASVAYQLPDADGSSGQGLTTDGSGVLSWSTLSANTPTSADGQALGSASLEWSDLFLADGGTIQFGNDQDVTLTHVADTGLLLSATDQLQFGDSGTYIHQSADGVLDLVSDTEIEINATTIDVNGNLDVSGTIVSAGTITGTLATAAQGNITSLGTLTALTVDDVAVDGKVITMTGSTDDTAVFTVAANGALTLETTDTAAAAANIQITADGTFEVDATTITLDSAGDVALDAGGGNIKFVNAGTEFARISPSSSDVIIEAKVQDKDLLFKGDDGGSVITALTLDMSAAGKATFNDQVVIGDGKLVLNSTAVTSTAAELNLLDGVSGLVQADLTKLAAVDSTAAELNIVDGGTSATSTTIADADRVVVNDDGTMVQVAVTDLSAYFDDEITAMPNLVTVGAAATASSVAGIDFYRDAAGANGSIYTHDVSGTDNSAQNNTAYGATAMDAVTTGDYNTAIGNQSGTDLNTGSLNTFVGYYSGAKVTEGADNVLVGREAGSAITSGDYNTLIGGSAGKAYDTESHNTGVGYEALRSGSLSGAEQNVAIGNYTLDAITSADNNVAIGYQAGSALTTGSQNVIIGMNAVGVGVLTGDNNVAIGYQAGQDLTSANKNTIIGDQAYKQATTGAENVIIGYLAGGAQAADSGLNVVIGNEAAEEMTSMSEATIVGYKAATSNTSGSHILAMGYQAYDGADTENHNMAIGSSALGGSVAGGEYNVAVGNYALQALTSGDFNTTLGYHSGTNISTGQQNVFIGYQAGKEATTSDGCTVVGRFAGGASGTMTGNLNVYVGNSAGASATSGANNTVVGASAADALTSGSENTIMGEEAGGALTIGDHNVLIGNHAGDAIVVERRNVAVGNNALHNHRTTASTVNDTGNTAVGFYAGATITTGSGNTAIGQNAFATRLTTGSNNVGIGTGVNMNSNSNDNGIVIGHNIEGNENRFVFGKASNVVENTFTSNANFAQSSDERLKTNITDNDLGLDFINELTTKTYKWKASNDLDQDDSQLAKRYNEENLMDTDVLMYGMLAQDVKAAIIKHNHPNFTGWSEDSYGVQNISREMFIIPLIKAVQELSAKVKALEDA